MLYGMETMAVTERQVGKMEVATGMTRKDKIRNEYVRGTAKIAKLDKLRNANAGMATLRGKNDDLPGRRKRGRPRRRWMDFIGAKEGDESTGRSGKYFRAVATPNREKPKEEEEEEEVYLKSFGKKFFFSL